MASRPQPDGARHVGRIVDPLARDDGETEPEVELLPPPSVPPPAEPDPVPPASGAEEAAPAGLDAARPEDFGGEALHPVKARLLARARARDAVRTPRVESESDTRPGGLDELHSDAQPPSLRSSLAPTLGARRPQLSPQLVALFGTLLGLATVASVIALAISLDPKPWEAKAPEAAAAEGEAETEAPTAPEAQVQKPKRVKIPGPWRIEDAREDPNLRIIEGKIGRDPFLKAIQDAGLERNQAYRALTALKDLKNLDRCDRSDQFVALVERSSKRLKAFEYIVSKEEVYQAREADTGYLVGKKLDLKVERKQIKAAFAVNGSIDASAEKAGLEAGLATVLSQALSGHMSLEELKTGDRLRVIAQEVSVLGEFSRYSGVEAVEVRSGKNTTRVYYFRGPTSRGYFDDKGRSPYEGGWRKPLGSAPITSKFNPKRMHPVEKRVMPHNGTDFGAPTGTPIGASSYGTVKFIGYQGASGNLVLLEHPNNYETGYAHLSRFAEGLKVGDQVKRLQVIGYVGSTGRSTGPHLHFSAKKDGKFIDPETLNLDGMRVLPPAERDAFAKVKGGYDQLFEAIPLPPEAPPPPPAAAAAAESDEDLMGGPDLELPGDPPPPPAPGPTAQAPKTTPASAPAAAAPKAVRPGGGSVYLTDEDLLKLQGRGDDGEVD